MKRLLLLACLFVAGCDAHMMEISQQDYAYLSSLADTNPELKPLIREALKDDIITRPEYNDIMSKNNRFTQDHTIADLKKKVAE